MTVTVLKPASMVFAVLFTILLGSSRSGALASEVSDAVSSVIGSFSHHVYSTNAFCSKKHCINPVFPGMEDLNRLQEAHWTCNSWKNVNQHMHFCSNAVDYDPAIPAHRPGEGSANLKDLVVYQDNAAATMYNFHLAGLGLDVWDYTKPEYKDDCIKSIWRMACFTYFPRAEAGCQDGAYSNYIRPCKSSCQNYVRACGVECCDESVQCVFEHHRFLKGKNRSMTTHGYADHDGPSSLCTGAAHRSSSPLGTGFWVLMALRAILSVDSAAIAGFTHSCRRVGRQALLVGIFAALAISLQGCDYDVPMHAVGNWRAEPDYLIRHQFIPPGGNARTARLNSCSLPRLSPTLQCNGRGRCKNWDPQVGNNDLSFCECDTMWADPECKTKRKSQIVAFLLSLFTGFLGFDEFYLGNIALGFVKLFTFGGCGLLWIADIIRIGSAPVYASEFRVAADLPHFAYVLSVTMYALCCGFALAYVWTTKHRGQKRKEAMILTLDEEARQNDAIKPFADAYGSYSAGRDVQRPILQNPRGMGSMPPMGMGGMASGPMPPSMPMV